MTATFAGEQSDSRARPGATGLQYLRARYYDPSIGRFLTADPLTGAATQPQTLDRYSYALNNPTNRVDPTGLASEGSGGGGGGLLLTAGLASEGSGGGLSCDKNQLLAAALIGYAALFFNRGSRSIFLH